MKRILKKTAVFIIVAVMLLTALPFCASAEKNGDYKLIAITFDDGPGAYTEELLDALAERGVKATFFLVGSNAKRYPELLERMVAEGPPIGNHSYNHENLAKLSTAKIQETLANCRVYLAAAGGEDVTYYIRPPYGSVNSTVKAAVDAPLINWSVDPEDWKYRNTDTVVNNIMSATKDGDIILLHDIYKTSVDAAKIVIDRLQAKGFEFVTVSELFRRRGIEPEAGKVYFYARNNGVNLGPLEPEPDPEEFDESLIEQHPAYPAIQYTRYKGIFSADGDFLPNKYMDRGLYVTVLGRFAGADVSKFTKSVFTDVPDDATCAPYAAWAAEKGFMGGYGNGLFGPEDNVTREQLSTIMCRYLEAFDLLPEGEIPELTYTDADKISDWAKEGVAVCSFAGLLMGKDDGSFDPQGYATRGQCAIIMERLAKYADPVGYARDIAIMNGEVPIGPDGREEPEGVSTIPDPSKEGAANISASDGVTTVAGIALTAAVFAKDRKKKK